MGLFDFLPWVRKSKPAKTRNRRTFAGALATNLNTDWRTSSASANSEIYTALRPLRNRSRDLYRNDPYAKSAVNTFVFSVIGEGMRLQAKIEKRGGGMNELLNTKIEDSWKRWTEKGNCTVDRRLSMAQLQRQVIRSIIIDGEVLIRVVRKRVGDSKIPVALELIEVDHLVDTGLARAENGNRIIMGVEVDQWNAPVAYHLYPYHPGDYQFMPQARFSETERVPAEEIMHLFVTERPGQVRGVPWLHNVIDRIRNISGYEEAEIVRSRIQSCAVGAITSPEPDAMTDYEDAGEDYKFLSPGEILRLAPGEEFTMGNAAAPNPSLEAFLRSMARSIAAGIGISYESLTRDYSNTSYSSARTALLAERDLYEILQAEFIETFLCPFYRKYWLESAVLSGEIPISGYDLRPEFYNTHKWTRRGWPWVDPLKDIEASKQALQLKMTTLTRELATRGIDLEELLKERAAEIELAKKYGLNIEINVPAAQGGPGDTGADGPYTSPDDNAPLLDGMVSVTDAAATPTDTTTIPETPPPADAATPTREDKLLDYLGATINALADRGQEEVNINLTMPNTTDGLSVLARELADLKQERQAEQQQLTAIREMLEEDDDEEVNINISFGEDGQPIVQPQGKREDCGCSKGKPKPESVRLFDEMTLVPQLLYRAKGKGKSKGKNCEKGQVCGLSCISKTKTCKKDLPPTSKGKAKKAVDKAKGGGSAGNASQNAGISVTPEQLDELYSRNSWWAGTKKQIESRLKSGVYAIDENGKLYKADDTKIANPLKVEAPTKESVKSVKFTPKERESYNRVESSQEKMKAIRGKSGKVEIMRADTREKESIDGIQYGNSGIWVTRDVLNGKYNVTHQGTGMAVTDRLSQKDATNLAKFLASTGNDYFFSYPGQNFVAGVRMEPKMVTLQKDYSDWLNHKMLKAKGLDPNQED